MGGRGGRPRRAADERLLWMAATGGGRAAAAEGRDWQRTGREPQTAAAVEKNPRQGNFFLDLEGLD